MLPAYTLKFACDNGTWSVTCVELPGFTLSHANFDGLIAKLPNALRVWRQTNSNSNQGDRR